MPKNKANNADIIIVDGVEYVRREVVDEALSIVGGLSELYDNLAANPSQPTATEREREAALDDRWTTLSDKLARSQKAIVVRQP